MIIILEGFDESGKSSLAKKLAEKTGVPVVHPGKRPFDFDDAEAMAIRQFGLLSFAKDVNLILDRATCISSFCYTWHMTDLFAKYQSQIILDPNILIIYCKYNGKKLTVSEHDRDGSVGIARKNKDQIIERYNSLFKGIPHHEYDYLDPKAFEKVAKYIGLEL